MLGGGNSKGPNYCYLGCSAEYLAAVSLTILYSCRLSSLSPKEKALHLQQPRRLRHRFIRVRVDRVCCERLVLGAQLERRVFSRAGQRRHSTRSSTRPQLVHEETRPRQQRQPGQSQLRRQRHFRHFQRHLQDQEGGPATQGTHQGGGGLRQKRCEQCAPDKTLLGGPLPWLSQLPRISTETADLERPLLHRLGAGLIPLPLPLSHELPGPGEDRVRAGQPVRQERLTRPPVRVARRRHAHLHPQLLHPGGQQLPLQSLQQRLHPP